MKVLKEENSLNKRPENRNFQNCDFGLKKQLNYNTRHCNDYSEHNCIDV